MNNFYCEDLNQGCDQLELTADEARHMVAARRLSQGDAVTVFNGKGLVAKAQLASINKKSVTLTIEKIDCHRPSSPEIILASALPKGDRLSHMLDMATQLGMTGFIPLNCERSVVTDLQRKIARYQRICINACKQSGRYHLPNFYPAMSPQMLLAQYESSDSLFVLGSPQANQLSFEVCEQVNKIILIIGPEGGFSPKELAFFTEAEIVQVRLAQAILRIETAAAAMLSRLGG